MNRLLKIALTFSAMLGASIAFSQGAWSQVDRRAPESRSEIQLSYAPIVRRVAPAVVNIFTSKTVRVRQVAPLFNDPFFRHFFGDQFGHTLGGTRKQVQNALGSGVIVDGRGLIVTNNHVIEGADEIKVVLADKREFSARILGTDARVDLAVLKINPGKGVRLPTLKFDDSDKVQVGDLVLAIGNPFGVGQTVTSGIVSALARTQAGLSDLNSYIQTDAAINPGNSGGALVAMDGRLVGLNTAIYSKSGGSMGIGFAIPSNLVRAAISSIEKSGHLVRPWLGASGQAVSADMAQALGLDRPYGVMLGKVVPGGPAEKGGLRVGDVVLAIDGREVETPQDLRFRLATMGVGRSTRLKVLRHKKTITLTVALVAPPETPPRDTTQVKGATPLSGAVIANINPALAQENDLEDGARGVIVMHVLEASNAGRLGFQPGDRILRINGMKTDAVTQVKQALSNVGRGWRIVIERNGQKLSLALGG
ncbi:DegQ family serine endoprotease [Varunaivibrio sulfuroxidans]|uniref:Serine protease Do n=1 Tax=Varunaivibrio sulfuroxidans TaxID=1773489 RepID=A0A4R3JAI5_9PROT|nr:DegQ family serine endoprotease [Varunaivibrio sulfuroxidans]TCS62076.1 serine protease Do [Varunaivibrio sulfuroxidans]WES30509.1 DegQ family serine endoprotease [Varunaivibrio sulfuroxidans]